METQTTPQIEKRTGLPECWQALEDCLHAGIDRVILYGPPGTGKTFAGMNYGNVANGAYRVTCTDDMTDLQVTGALMPTGNNGAWAWIQGAALKAWKTGGRLVIDEIDKAGADVFATLLNMLDSPESASWEQPNTNQVYRPQQGFSAIMTTNIEDMAELPEALGDRFPVAIRINQPHPDALELLSRDLRTIAVQLADAGEQRISLRKFMAFDKLRAKLGDEQSAKIIFTDRASSILDAMKVNSIS